MTRDGKPGEFANNTCDTQVGRKQQLRNPGVGRGCFMFKKIFMTTCATVLFALGCLLPGSNQSITFPQYKSLEQVPLILDQTNSYVLHESIGSITIKGKTAPNATVDYALSPGPEADRSIRSDQHGRFILKVPLAYRNHTIVVIAKKKGYLQHAEGIAVKYLPSLMDYATFYAAYEKVRSTDTAAFPIGRHPIGVGLLSQSATLSYSDIKFEGEFDQSESYLRRILFVLDKTSASREERWRYDHSFLVLCQVLGLSKTQADRIFQKIKTGTDRSEFHSSRAELTINQDDQAISIQFSPLGS